MQQISLQLTTNPVGLSLAQRGVAAWRFARNALWRTLSVPEV
jgi:hypothetical protein